MWATTLEIAKQLKKGEIMCKIFRAYAIRHKNSDQSLYNANFQDVQVDDMPSDFDIAFSRFGVMFFEDPVRRF